MAAESGRESEVGRRSLFAVLGSRRRIECACKYCDIVECEKRQDGGGKSEVGIGDRREGTALYRHCCIPMSRSISGEVVGMNGSFL